MEDFKKEYYNGFPISERNRKKIDNWKREHNSQKHNGQGCGAIGGRYSYTFTPTSIETVGKIVCSCGEEYCFQEL